MHRFGFLLISLLLPAPALLSCRSTVKSDPVEINISRLEAFNADGDPSEWKNIEPTRLYSNALGEYPDPGDLTAFLRTAWDDDGILICAEINDDHILPDPAAPWNGDALEVFLSPYRGSDDILQFSYIQPAEGKKSSVDIRDYRKSPELTDIQPKSDFFVRRVSGKTIYEVRIDPECLGIDAREGSRLAMQVYVQDRDLPAGSDRQQVIWYNLGHSYQNSFAMYDLNLTASVNTVLQGSSDVYITDGKEIRMTVFGAEKGDNIVINRNGNPWLTARSETNTKWEPDIFRFGENGPDPEKDSLIVTINGAFAGFHNLYISPRLYVRTKAPPFDQEIRNFVLKDRLSPPPQNGVLFIGSSSIRKWNSLRKDFPELKIIQRGFGGSTSREALMYMDKIVLPYHPSTIVYYEGDNDVPKGIPPDSITKNVRDFIEKVLEENAGTKIFLLSPKPSVSRMKYWPRYKTVQQELRELAERYPGVVYVDVSSPMFDGNGRLKNNIFVSDGVHMNEKGYRIWTKVLRKTLGLHQAD